jgi:uncharacterized membrane protein (DUF2068 family)
MAPTPGTRHPRKRRHLDWELIACGVRGHVLIDPATVPADVDRSVIVRKVGGDPWYRCVRCDAWVAVEPPGGAVRAAPGEDELPLRGKALHDRVVLRLIAVDRVLHFVVLSLLGIAVLAFAADRAKLHDRFYQIVTALQTAIAGGPVSTTGHVGIVRDLDRLFTLSKGTLIEAGVALLCYALLEGVEAVGLWHARRWAEYLTFVATAVLLPFEVYELHERVSPLKVIGFLINLTVVAYLIYAKRLFGIRGGGAVEERERARDSGWQAITRTAPGSIPNPGESEPEPASVSG